MSDQLTVLAAEAASVDQAATPPAPPRDPPSTAQSAPAPISPRDEAHGLLTFAVGLLGPLYPCLRNVYEEATIARLADVAGPVMAKYNVTAGAFFERWLPEIQFVIVAAPIAAQTVKALRAEAAERRTAAAADVGDASSSSTADGEK